MADQLTDSEVKMLRERCVKHRCIIGGLTSESSRPDPDAMDLATELLLAAKEKAARIVETSAGHANPREMRAMFADEIRNSESWGDMFEVK